MNTITYHQIDVIKRNVAEKLPNQAKNKII